MRRFIVITLSLALFLLTLPLTVYAEESPQFDLGDHVVAIDPSDTGPTYTVTNRDGSLLDADLGEQQLREKYPDLYAQLTAVMYSDLSLLAITSFTTAAVIANSGNTATWAPMGNGPVNNVGAVTLMRTPASNGYGRNRIWNAACFPRTFGTRSVPGLDCPLGKGMWADSRQLAPPG